LIAYIARFRQSQRLTDGFVSVPCPKTGNGTGNRTGWLKKPAMNLKAWGPDMSDSDGIQISDKPSWEHTGKELFAILGKRIIALPSKMLGFKPFCLYLATWLLVRGYIKDWIWFAVMVMVLFGIVGLKVIAHWKPNQ
jgi:hypothetical protein